MKTRTFILAMLVVSGLNAQDNKTAYKFTNKIDIEALPVLDQQNTGTCWSFSTSSFVESELIRLGKGKTDLSEMHFVYHTYVDKAVNYVSRNGDARFSEGALAHDVMNAIRKHGIVPQSAYSGKLNSDIQFNHREMVRFIKGALVTIEDREPVSDKYDEAVAGILNAYMGEAPKEFKVDDKKHTPFTYRDELGLNPDDYYSITSYTHEPFYSKFILNIPDNFSNGSFYNVKMNELESVVDHALENGFTIAWDADVSEWTYNERKGVATLPINDFGKSNYNKAFDQIEKEIEVTQESRQVSFESKNTTDDHLMHIVGKATDQNGAKYYIVKNSHGTEGRAEGNQGRIYVSRSYFLDKGISILLHKDAIPKEVKSKLSIQ